MKYKCGNCGSRKYWKLGSGEFRCRVCRKDTKPKFISGFNLSKKDWIEVIDLFLLEVNSPTIKEKTKRSLGTVNKMLRRLRLVMAKDVPGIFSGTVEVDETYLGGQKKNSLTHYAGDYATFENPHQYSVGMVHVFVNGGIAETGDKTLALKLEKEGYAWAEKLDV